jgi:hypothetical protein
MFTSSLTAPDASACGFERQAARRGAPLYEDLRQKIQVLALAHADETSWRHDGQNYWVWYAGDDDLTCFRRPHVPPTNNQAERSLRPVVIMRKVIHGTRGPGGQQRHDIQKFNRFFSHSVQNVSFR